MNALSKLRKWANRDEGRIYQIGNEAIHGFTVAGVLFLIGALVLLQIRSVVGISVVWALASSAIGVALLLLGLTRRDSGDGA